MQRHSATRQTISRRLPAACLILVSLLLSLPIGAKEWYGETIVKNKNFYLYNAGTGQFLTSTGALSNEPKDAAIWVFSGTTSGTIKTGSNGINFTPPKIANVETEASWSGTTFATLKVNSSPSAFTINGSSNQYVFSVIKTYGRLSPRTYYRYIASDGSKFFSPAENTTEVTKWYLISETQMQQHISVSTNSLDFGSPAIGDTIVRTFTVTHTNPTSINISVIGASDVTVSPSSYNVSTSTFGKQTITVKFIPSQTGSIEGASIKVAADNNNNNKHYEVIDLTGEVEPMYFEPEWLISDFIHYNVGSTEKDTITNPVALPKNIAAIKDINITNLTSDNTAVLNPFTKDGVLYVEVAGEGTATLSVAITQTNRVKPTNTTKTITVSSLTQQKIQWDANYEQMLVRSTASLNATAVDINGKSTGCPITYTLEDNSTGISVNGTTLSAGSYEATTSVTATVAPCNGYAGATMTKTIKVNSATSGCTQGTITLGSNKTINKDNTFTYEGLVCPEKITIKSTRANNAQQPWILQERRANGAWETVCAQLNSGTAETSITKSLHIDAIAVRIKSAANNNHTLKSVTYTANQYVKYPTGGDITLQTTVGAMAQSTIAIDWCNGSYFATVDNPNFTVTRDYFGTCGTYGTKELKISYKPTANHPKDNPETATLSIYLYGSGGNTLKTQISLKGIADKLNQQISWNVPSTAKTTDVINLLKGCKPTTNTGLRSFTFQVTAGTEVAEVNPTTGELTIKKDGDVTVQVTEAGNDIYAPVSATRTISISKVDLTCTELPTATAIIEGQSLAESTISGGKFQDGIQIIKGKLSWQSTTVDGSGEYNVVFTPENTDWYNNYIVSIPVTVLKKPTIECNPTEYDFGSVPVTQNATTTIAINIIDDQEQDLDWGYDLQGDNFYVESIGETGCVVRFSPTTSADYEATLTITAQYETEALSTLVVSAPQVITLRGKGSIPAAGLGFSGDGAFGSVYGTKKVSRNIDVSFISVANLSETSFTWKNNSNITEAVSFSYSFNGTYQSQGANLGKLVLTAGVNKPVTEATTYSDILVVTSTKTEDGGTITAEFPVSVTLQPKQANTLALRVVEEGEDGLKAKMSGATVSYYYLYIDETDVPIFKAGSRNNTATTISITPTSPADHATRIQINSENCTLSPLAADKNTNISITINQPATDEYEGYNQTIKVRVIKRTPLIVIRGLEATTTANKYYAWRYKTYENFVESTGDGAITVSCNYEPYNQYISFESISSRTWNFTTEGTNINSIQLKIVQEETETYEAATNLSYYIQIISDPRHVGSEGGIPDRFVWVKKTLWENTAAGMNGKTFTRDIVNAEWVGDQWVNGSWQDTKWANRGNNYAYVLHDGGSVVFNFTGVPYYTNITRYFAAGAASGGTLTVEESADGMVWTGIYSTAASGGSNIYMNGNSRYLRLSYNKSGTEQEYIVLWNFIRERDIATATSKFVLCKQQSSGSSYRPATVVLQTANWGLNWTKTTAEEDKVPIVVLEQTNPAFSISIQQPDSNGIDDYQEVIAYVSYNPALDETDNHMGQFKLSNSCSKNSAASYHTVFTVQAVPAKKSIITVKDTAKTGIQTGTVAPASLKGYHRGSWDVKLTHCFDKDGNALFDRLYIFGITNVINGRTNAEGYPIINNSLTQDPESAYRTEDDKKIQWEFNATTMCYVYTKGEDGKTYNYDDGLSFDATAQRFDMGSSMNGKKLYFTGYCPFACMGTTPREEGWMYFTGDDASVDIYLEDCEIMGKYKTASGCGHSKDYAYNKVELTYSVAGGGDNNYLTGCSSIFVFMGNQNKTFTPNIHLCGTNSLIGQAGSFMSEIVGKAFGLEIATGIKNVGQGSAPISILNRDNSGSVVLTLDDNWPDGSTTNGYLALDATYQQAPCIDLGSVNGSVVINGGQYHLRNSAADNQYTCNTVASYRKYSKTVTVGSMSETISLYGFGGDHPEGCSMTINSGTFTMFKNMQGENFGKDYYRDQEEFLDLRLPQNTKINGGTFNGINFVLACPAANAQGVKPTNNKNTELCLKDIATSTAEDGSTIIQLPQEFIQDVQNKSGYIYRDPTPSRIVKDSVTKNLLYGGQSLNADEDGYVHFMLPSSYKINNANYTWCDALVSYHINNWATCTPAVSVGTSGQTGGISNETKVAHGASSGGLIDTTFQMLYLNVDDNIKGRSVKATGSISVEFKGNYGNITNTEDYSIGRHLNIMMNVEADKWMTFVAPFDITDVKVIEIAYEDSISQLSKADALAAQAEASINFFYKMANYIIPSLSGGRTVSHDLNTVLGVSGNDVNNERRQAGLQNLPFGQFDLDHYDGTNLWDANYYLYEIEGAYNTFTTSGTGSDLDIRWIPVKEKASKARKDSSILMHQGHVYAIQFPYCPLCNDVDSRTYYDYWTGKFIIFHGYGPQTVFGSNAQTTIKNISTDAGTARLTGNYTFKDMSLNAGTAYLHNTENDQFERNDAAATIKPTQGYMLFTAPVNSPQVASFSRAGRVVSYVQDEEVTTDSHVPSIGDRTSMLLYRLDGGFAIDPVRSQQVKLYDMRGQVLFSGYLTEGTHHPFYLSQGLYVLQGEYETLKVLVE